MQELWISRDGGDGTLMLLDDKTNEVDTDTYEGFASLCSSSVMDYRRQHQAYI
jgi:hypothetical protein